MWLKNRIKTIKCEAYVNRKKLKKNLANLCLRKPYLDLWNTEKLTKACVNISANICTYFHGCKHDKNTQNRPFQIINLILYYKIQSINTAHEVKSRQVSSSFSVTESVYNLSHSLVLEWWMESRESNFRSKQEGWGLGLTWNSRLVKSVKIF